MENCKKCHNTGWVYSDPDSLGLSSCDCKWSKLGYIGGFD